MSRSLLNCRVRRWTRRVGWGYGANPLKEITAGRDRRNAKAERTSRRIAPLGLRGAGKTQYPRAPTFGGTRTPIAPGGEGPACPGCQPATGPAAQQPQDARSPGRGGRQAPGCPARAARARIGRARNHRRIRVPAGEDPGALLQAIAPWLAEARRTRAVRLRHGPRGVPNIEQRSCLVAPLQAQSRVLGYLYADVEGRMGRFDASHRELIGMFAAQAAVALDNQQRMRKLEREAEASAAALAERVGELEVIRAIQRGGRGSASISRASSRWWVTSCARYSAPVT